MSAASIQHRPALSRSFQYDDYNNADHFEPAVLSIEELRAQLYSCITCGVSWLEDHVCLDCAECGGYSLQRPCPLCDGRCASYWKRDLAMSHACGKARWTGTCQLQSSNSSESTTPEVPSKQETSSSNLNRSLARFDTNHL